MRSARPVIHSDLVLWYRAPARASDPRDLLQALPVADDDRERAGVHEIHRGQVKHDLHVRLAGLRQGLVELAARHDVEVTSGLMTPTSSRACQETWNSSKLHLTG